jgi:predicted hydrolase (HD superfamily)
MVRAAASLHHSVLLSGRMRAAVQSCITSRRKTIFMIGTVPHQSQLQHCPLLP